MNRIKELRVERGLSQDALGKIIHVEQQTIAGYETEKFSPSLDVLKSLSEYFETSIEYILGKVDIRTPVTKFQTFELDSNESMLIENFRKLSTKSRQDIIAIVIDIVEEKNRK